MTYTDATAMQYSSINNNSNAVTVTPPAGVPGVMVSFVDATPTQQRLEHHGDLPVHRSRRFVDAGGRWHMDVNMAANQVENTADVHVPASQSAARSQWRFRGPYCDEYQRQRVGGQRRQASLTAITQANADGTLGTVDVIVFSNTAANGNTNFYDGTQHTVSLLSALPSIIDPVTITGPGETGVRSRAGPARFGSLTPTPALGTPSR